MKNFRRQTSTSSNRDNGIALNFNDRVVSKSGVQLSADQSLGCVEEEILKCHLFLVARHGRLSTEGVTFDAVGPEGVL